MNPPSLRATALAAVTGMALLLAACAATPPAPSAAPAPASPAAAQTLAPNANLVAQGIPPIPLKRVREVERYTDFRGHSFVDWHPGKREMLVAHRAQGQSTTQLWRVAAPLAEPEALTDGSEPVRVASWEPRRGEYIVFERSVGGNEADQLYRLDPATKAIALLTDITERHEFMGWMNRTSQLLYMSVPLDRTAAGGTRSEITQTLTLLDPAKPQSRRRLVELPGGGWFVGDVATDDRRVALTRYLSATESQVWLLDVASGRTTQILPAPGAGAKPATHLAARFLRDGSGLLVVTDRDGEFRELQLYRFATRRLQSVTAHIDWDVTGGSATEDGRTIAVQANIDGRSELRLIDGRTLKELPAPRLPAGSVTTSEFHRKLPELAFALNSSQAPSQVLSLNPATGKVEAWTKPQAAPGVDMARFGDQQIVRWKSFDGRSLSGLLNAPPARFGGKRPVLVAIHGGPEAQATMGFIGRMNYLVEELGIAVLQPNVRGSAGYGKTFLALDNGMKREDAVKDIGALLDWIATQPNLDASRVVVEGGSYGGFMSLASAVAYSDRIAGAVDVVGISNFVTFLRNTESYRRDLRRVEYGDERDPAMRTFLEKISPLTNAAKIRKPLFVVHGRNDPRVPYTEAEQIVAQVRGNGTPVWYLRAENEGHGFARKENADFQFYALVAFLRETMRLGAP
jgi:dipeptidyl aminopeptidase/acylaminoacyl peptidase